MATNIELQRARGRDADRYTGIAWQRFQILSLAEALSWPVSNAHGGMTTNSPPTVNSSRIPCRGLGEGKMHKPGGPKAIAFGNRDPLRGHPVSESSAGSRRLNYFDFRSDLDRLTFRIMHSHFRALPHYCRLAIAFRRNQFSLLGI